jgi:hypothetical protein
MAFGDNAHTRLLGDDWKWNGVWYAKSTNLLVNDGRLKSLEEVDMTLTPATEPHNRIDLLRRATWVLKVGTSAICSFKDLPVAAHALADRIKGT